MGGFKRNPLRVLQMVDFVIGEHRGQFNTFHGFLVLENFSEDEDPKNGLFSRPINRGFSVSIIRNFLEA
jgi:hypothetical protein